jgi:hypothetical protein
MNKTNDRCTIGKNSFEKHFRTLAHPCIINIVCHIPESRDPFFYNGQMWDKARFVACGSPFSVHRPISASSLLANVYVIFCRLTVASNSLRESSWLECDLPFLCFIAGPWVALKGKTVHAQVPSPAATCNSRGSPVTVHTIYITLITVPVHPVGYKLRS